MKRMNYFLASLMLLCTFALQAQQGPIATGKVDGMTYVPPLSSRSLMIPAVNNDREIPDGRIRANWQKIVPGKGVGFNPELAARKRSELEGVVPSRGVDLSFTAAFSSSQPTDPSGALGPDHYFAVFNTGFRIFEKDGTPLTPQLSPLNIFPSTGCCDLTVSYDNAADRWVVTFLGGGVQVAVSDGPDPVNDGWYVYRINTVNDYQKLSIWSDGYYITDNTSSTSRRVYAMEREAMLAGDPDAQVVQFPLPGIATNGFFSPQAFHVSNADLPAAGSAPVVFLQDDAFAGVPVGNDHVKLWEIDVNWVSPGSSTISDPQEISLDPFTSVFDGGSFSNLSQPFGGSAIDAIQSTIMNQAQFRKFPTHNSAIFNFVEDTDPTTGELAGIRWVELRQDGDGQPWTLFQEGTYNAPDGKHAWMGSMIMDNRGNIGMGYMGMSSPSSSTPVRVSSFYTGRLASDPEGAMTIAETLIEPGIGNIPGIRVGDYSKIDVDPNDDQTFFFNNEQIISGGRANVVGVFKIASDLDNDTGVVAISQPNDGTLSSTETVEITVRNFGILPQSNVPVSFSIDGGTPVNEVVPGPIAPGANEVYTFTATADLGTLGTTYSVTARTNLAGDEFPDNDAVTKDVTYLQPNDVGITALVEPTTGFGLGAAEDVTVEITNFGGETQTTIPVSFTLDGGTPVSETYSGSIATGETDNYTFTVPVDLSEFQDYEFVATTALAGDADPTNDSLTVNVENQFCEPSMDCSFGDGFRLVRGGGIDNPSGCEGYADFTAQVGEFLAGASTDITFTTNYGDQFIRVWIDYNDDFVFTPDELVINNVEIASGQATGSFTATFPANVPAGATLGQHIMRVKSNWDGPVPNDACEETTYGETEDYTANVVDVLGVEEQAISDSDMIITSTDNNLFNIEINNPKLQGALNIQVHNVMGQKILSNNFDRQGGSYSYSLDMSYVSAGVYLVRVGNANYGKVKRIIVN